MIKKFFRDETGLELSEYAVAAALVAIAVVGAFTALGTAISGKWTGLITRGSDAVWAGPDKWNRRKPGSFVFTCSMSDFFHEDVPLPMFAEALNVIDGRVSIIL